MFHVEHCQIPHTPYPWKDSMCMFHVKHSATFDTRLHLLYDKSTFSKENQHDRKANRGKPQRRVDDP